MPLDHLFSKSAGFTLLELLVSLAVFAILSALAYGGLLSVSKNYEITRDYWQQLGQWQRGFFLIERDILQIVPRLSRNSFGEVEAPVLRKIGDNQIVAFTRAGLSNPAEIARGETVRVAYLLEDKKLLRRVWYYPDRVYAEAQSQQVLFDQVETVEIRFLNQEDDWQDTWGTVEPLPLPKALELTVTLKNLGEIRRLWAIAQ
jgi:general secretion pathway protein J